MKLFNFKNTFLVLIILLAGFLRFHKLTQIPNGFYVDEAAIGYNSYSILTTLKDEYGKTLPIFLRSYGAYSSPLYTYLTAIPIKLFGLSIFSTRFLSALSGTLCVLLFYPIVKKLKLIKSENILIFGTFFFAILPWNIFFSRGAYEANLAFLILLLSLNFHLSSEKKLTFKIISIALLSLSTYAYQANRLIAFLLLPIFLLNSKSKVKGVINAKFTSLVILFIAIQIPQLILITTPAFKLRAAGLFYGDVVAGQAIKIHKFLPYPVDYILSFLREFSSQLVAYISPRNLFWLGDPDLQRSIPDLSVFYSWMVIPYLFGFLVILSRLKEPSVKKFLFMCIVFIVPAALTKDPFSTLRSLPFSFSVMVVVLLGFEKLFMYKHKIIPTLFLAIVIPLSFLQLWRSYFVLFPHERASLWGYGFEPLMTTIYNNPDTNYLIDQTRIKPAYIQYLFFAKYDPAMFQAKFNEGFRERYYEDLAIDLNYEIENVRFGTLDWNIDAYKEQVIVGDEFTVSENQAKEHFLTKVYELRDPIGEIVFLGYQTDPQKKCQNTNYADPLCAEFR